jgi:FkbM family methyltransferase
MNVELEAVTTKNGHNIKGFKGDYITKKIKKSGLYEKTTLEFIRAYLKDVKEPIIADIGANIGNHTLDFSTYAKKVFSFEPIEMIYHVLAENVAENHIKNVCMVNKALSDKEGLDKIYLRPNNIGASSISNRYGVDQSVGIEKIIGDDFFEKEKINKLNFIKIDVEGHEKNVLKGLLKTIRKFKPTIIMEWDDLEAISVFNDDGLLDKLRKEYDIHVLGSNCDYDYWEDRFLAKARRKFSRLFFLKKPLLYHFDESRAYRNILLTPKQAALV